MNEIELIQDVANRAGCSGFGVTTAEPFPEVAATIAERRDSGLSGRLRFTFKDPNLATDVSRSFPWADRLVVVSWPYMPAAGNPIPAAAGTARIARFAAEDHYEGLRTVLDEIAGVLRGNGWRAEVLVDDDRLVDRAAAVRAGVGWWGKSTMVLDPRHGPWLLLGSVATNADLETTAPMKRDCGTCDACLPACPTGAIIAPGVLDASLCIAHWTQMAGVIPIAVRQAMGDRVYGCDDCLDACPPGIKRVSEAERGPGRVDIEELLAADDVALLAAYSHFYLPRRNPRYLRRNALVALGNSTAEAVAAGAAGRADIERSLIVLAGYLGHPDDIFRLHAAWAIARIGGNSARQLLDYQLQRERSAEVGDEIRMALGDC